MGQFLFLFNIFSFETKSDVIVNTSRIEVKLERRVVNNFLDFCKIVLLSCFSSITCRKERTQSSMESTIEQNSSRLKTLFDYWDSLTKSRKTFFAFWLEFSNWETLVLIQVNIE